MKKKLNRNKGFTLIELIMVIVILAVLGAVAIPTYVDLSSEAKISAETGVVGGVRAALTTYFVDQTKGNRGGNGTGYPSTLDGVGNTTACSKTAKCFVTVLTQGGVTSDWTKTSGTVYIGPTGTTYTYDNSDGSFI